MRIAQKFYFAMRCQFTEFFSVPLATVSPDFPHGNRIVEVAIDSTGQGFNLRTQLTRLSIAMPGSPKLLKAGIVLIDPGTARVVRVIALQYNPQSLSRSIKPQWYEPTKEKNGADLRLQFKGPAVETIKLEAEIDATDKKRES